MHKKIVWGVIGLIVFVGVAGLVVGTTYARGGEMRGKGMIKNAPSTAVISAQRDAADKAIEAGDYAAWKAAMGTFTNGRATSAGSWHGNGITTVVTEANFAKFAEMNKLMRQADAIRKEIGLDRGNAIGQGMGMMGFRHTSTTAATNR